MATKPSWLYIPEEVIEQILIRIPCTKSILGCTLVCKSWYSLIKSSRFINTHLSGPNNTKYLLCHTSVYVDGESVNGYSLYSDSEPYTMCVTLKFPGGLKHVKVHGCCNGVICYTKARKNHGNIYLWNPFVRKLKILPKFQDKYYRKGVKETIGFWFDKEKNDYEVVKISYSTEASCVDVYSLRSNSWKTISDSCPGIPFSICEYNVVYAKGTLYWLAEEWEGWRIVSLNMDSAMFREVFISKKIQTIGIWYLKGVSANSLVILRKKGLRRVCIVKVHKESLELLYTDADQSVNDCLDLIGFRNNGEALLRQDLRYNILFEPYLRISSYKFGAKQLTNMFITRNFLFSAHPFVETLVLLDESDVNVFGWEKMVRILETLFVNILNCEWLDKF